MEQAFIIGICNHLDCNKSHFREVPQANYTVFQNVLSVPSDIHLANIKISLMRLVKIQRLLKQKLHWQNPHQTDASSVSKTMSLVVRKTAFCICENKDADQLRNFRPLAILCGCTACFVSDQVGNQNVGFLMTRLICFTAVLLGNPEQAQGHARL